MIILPLSYGFMQGFNGGRGSKRFVFELFDEGKVIITVDKEMVRELDQF